MDVGGTKTMANKLYQQMNSDSGFPNNLIQDAQRLKKQFGGDPNTYIQNLLNSGRVSQAQYDAAMRKAEQFRRLFGR